MGEAGHKAVFDAASHTGAINNRGLSHKTLVLPLYRRRLEGRGGGGGMRQQMRARLGNFTTGAKWSPERQQGGFWEIRKIKST